jgi:hypothetical protein
MTKKKDNASWQTRDYEAVTLGDYRVHGVSSRVTRMWHLGTFKMRTKETII